MVRYYDFYSNASRGKRKKLSPLPPSCQTQELLLSNPKLFRTCQPLAELTEFHFLSPPFGSDPLCLRQTGFLLLHRLTLHPSSPLAEKGNSYHFSFGETWLSGANDWIYRHLHKATLRMEELLIFNI